jgi:Flp pilus assembly protein TadG
MGDGERQHDGNRLERGQATVELALVLPVVVLLLMILIQAALVAKDQLLVQHAAREAARSAATSR